MESAPTIQYMGCGPMTSIGPYRWDGGCLAVVGAHSVRPQTGCHIKYSGRTMFAPTFSARIKYSSSLFRGVGVVFYVQQGLGGSYFLGSGHAHAVQRVRDT